MPIEQREAEVVRYFVREPFNPGSSKQILGYMKAHGLQGGVNYKSKSGNPSTDKQTLKRLSRRHPIFKKILEWREVSKIQSTYVAPNLQRVGGSGSDGRIHPSFLHNPSTMRLSSHDPNIQNVPGAEDDESLATKFRQCIVATEGCLLVESDFAAIEAVLTGYFMQDDHFLRIAPWAHTYALAASQGVDIPTEGSDEELGGRALVYPEHGFRAVDFWMAVLLVGLENVDQGVSVV